MAASFHGECTCTVIGCARAAYFAQSGAARCGRHADRGVRKPLPKNPGRAARLAAEYAVHRTTVDTAGAARAAAGERGAVTCCKMTMFQGQRPVFVDGAVNVFPNFKHANRYGGMGMPSLSPKAMGPVDHGQPGLPAALNLENFHQFSKIFDGESMADFRVAQRAAFRDPVPHRHKPLALAGKDKNKNKNLCRGWVWTRADGTAVVKSYVECRQFYCNYYARFAAALPALATLRAALAAGTSLRICGYDGHPYAPDAMADHYLDDARPFGHEAVLFTMLTLPEDAWPWRVHKDEEF